MGADDNKLMRFMSVISERMNLASKLGVQFGGLRDLYKVFGYKNALTFNDYYGKYERQDVAARIIDAPAAALWADPPTLKGLGPAFDDAWKKHARTVKLWHHLERLDKLAGLGRFAIMIVGFDDGAGLERPVTKASEVLFLRPVCEAGVKAINIEADPSKARYALPVSYRVALAKGTVENDSSGIIKATGVAKEIDVHHSRVLHVVENPLEGTILGIPRLSRVYNLLDDLLKTVGGASETYWLTGNRGIQADIDKDMEIDAEDAAALAESLDDYMHQLRRVIRTRGVKINPLESETPDPSGVFDAIVSLLSGATGIPRRILLGSEAGQLASEQDRANWAERVHERQESFGETIVLDPYVRLVSAAGVLPAPESFDDLEYEWPDPFHMSPLEESQMFAQKARAAVNFSRQWQYGAPIITQEESRASMGFPAEGGPEMTLYPLGGEPPDPEDPEKMDDKDVDDDEKKGKGPPNSSKQTGLPPGVGPNAKIRGPSDLS